MDMDKIFTGMIFAFLDFNINIGSSQIGLIPDFVGYIFIVNGLFELSSKSSRFQKVQTHASIMAFYTGILYALDLFGISFSIGVYIRFFMGLVSTVLSLYISYNIVMGVKDIEKAEGWTLDGDRLFKLWGALFIFSIASYGLYLIPGLNLAVIIGAFIVGLGYIICFNGTRKLYNIRNGINA
jgi:hypothetical protein